MVFQSSFQFLFIIFIILNATQLLAAGKSKGSNKSKDKDNDSDASSSSSLISIALEDGICGDGSNYTYFVRPGSSKYVAFFFDGNSFCADDAICYSQILDGGASVDIETYTERFNSPSFLSEPFTYDSTDDDDDSRVSSDDDNDNTDVTWTIVFLPQCTEDFHVGYNSVNLGELSGTFHFQGGNNIGLLIDNILNEDDSDDIITDYVDFKEIEHLVVIGSSSGAYGATVWSNQLFDYVSEGSLKTLILDSYWLDKTLELDSGVLAGLVVFYDVLNGPAATADIISEFTTTGDITLPALIDLNQDKYCDLFVSQIWYEYDPIMAGFHVFFTGDTQFYNETYYANQFLADLEERFVFDDKRASHYVARGSGHHIFYDQNYTSLSTKCEEAPTLNEYLIDVVGDKSLVDEYFGASKKRVRDFPKYRWNNLIIECLDCDDDE